jgi:avidin family protein
MSLAGVWKNEYGSTMTLSLANTNLVTGTYQSSTGSTGTYEVIGYQTNADPTPSAGQAVSLAIDWHSVVQGPPDNSWHWVSGLSGQISIQNGVEQLVLEHALVASIAFPGLAAAGTYIDKLIYQRIATSALQSAAPSGTAAPVAADPLVGSWFAMDGTALLIQSVVPYPGNAFGWIFGKMTWNGGPSMIYGFTDINAFPDKLNLQSVSIVGLPSDAAGPAISFSGTLDLRNGQLTLLNLQSQSTAPGNTYVQTLVSSKIFTKR